MINYIYSAYIDPGYDRRPERVVLARVQVLKRSEKQVWVKASRATGYVTRLDANHNRDLNLGATPEEAMDQLRKRLAKDLEAAESRVALTVNRIHLADTTPAIEEEP